MKALIAVLPGDGIGPEVVGQALRVLEYIGSSFGHDFTLRDAHFGGCAIEATGKPLPEETLALCREADAVLLGAVGGPKWDPPAPVRPEQGLLALRKELNLYTNLRPVRVHPALVHASTLRPEVLRGVDLLIVRELTSGLYFGEKRRSGQSASDVCTYTVDEISRVVRAAFAIARGRKKRVAQVDKANVLETSRLWREVTAKIAREEFPDIALENILVDSCAMHLVRDPRRFDVIVTENLFGDILSDEAAMIAGSIGMLPSASLGEGTRGLYEPIHGSAPDIAGKNLANPYGTILSVAMLLRHSLGLWREADAIEDAVSSTLTHRVFTADLAPAGAHAASCKEAGGAVIAALSTTTNTPFPGAP